MLAGNVFKIPETQIRIVTGDVGGGFGTKGWQYVEHRLTLMAARRLGRPVKWSCERSEVLLADEHGRDVVAEAELALDKDLKFLGLRARLISNIGAYLSSDRNLLATFGSLGAMVGVYDIPAGYAHLTVAFSNQPATAPYRGAGRPEAIYIIERLIEDAARELGTDRVALRRKNLIPPSRLPFKTPLGGLNYDCGDFPGIMEKALKLGDAAGFPERRADLQKRGRLRGLGIANAIERAASPGPEFAELRFNTGGGATLLMGTIHQGQGHETSFRQIAYREARPRSERHPLCRWRHRRRRVRHRHQRLALDRDRRHRADVGGGQDHRQGEKDRRASARSGRGRCAIRRRPLHHRRHRSRPRR